MLTYSNILVAIDLNEEAEPVSKKACAIADLMGAKLHFMHVTEPLSYAYGGDVPMDLSAIQEQLHEHAEQRLSQFMESHNLQESEKILCSGHIESEVHRVAEEIGADLIIVGSHGRHGLALLLGSTSNSVLHGATCDVLAVRI
ncbi:MAG: universal stress protein [Gammaproteobacteria bacterium]|nr:universal stress protein [Gammaproteobacteria bacterium]MCP4881443.1 universal stress protein [Gammaproteobacteria bacterium]MDP6166091.1 universal stress protein [Gammaproteobacteria bacterium]